MDSEGFHGFVSTRQAFGGRKGCEREVRNIVGISAARETLKDEVMTPEGEATMFLLARLENICAHVGRYGDGMKYLGSKSLTPMAFPPLNSRCLSDPVVRAVVENAFGVTEDPKPV